MKKFQLIHFLTVIILGFALTGAAMADSVQEHTGGRFILKADGGRIVTDRDFAGKLMLMYFGYTHCPDICPTSMISISEALDMLGEDVKYIQPLFISVDPERDSKCGVLNEYLQSFHPSFIGLTGNKAAIESITGKFRVKYRKDKADETGNYEMDHTSSVFVMGPDGRFLTRFPYGSKPERIADGLRQIIKKTFVSN